MLIITKRNAPEEALDAVKEYLIRHGFDIHQSTGRSEERRVGKECHVVCRSRWSPYH